MITPDLFQIRGVIDPTEKFIYMDISKNASTKILSTLRSIGWTKPPILKRKEKDDFLNDYLTDKTIFCVLREPYERWLTAFVTFAESIPRGNFNPSLHKLLHSEHWYITLQIIFEFCNNFEFDFHTKLQCNCFDDYINITKVNFVLFNENVCLNLQNWCKTVNLEIFFNSHYLNKRSESNLMYNNLIYFLDENPHYKEKLMSWLQPDYEFFNSVKFVA